ncbi:MAG: peptide deformylase [Actinobacteria bacterium]|nr:peptide deformylase [Actinomycetota bacterium]
MTILEIRLFGDPVLRQTAREVTDFDERLRKLESDMLDTMRDAPGVGLAAPQVGVLKRVFVWELEQEEAPALGGAAVVNPVLEDASDDTIVSDEGCLSFPGLFYEVERPLVVRIRHRDVHGEEHVRELSDLPARIWLHEMDHLNGILFIDHLAAHDRKEVLKHMREYRLEQGLDLDPPAGGNLLLGRR